MLSMPALGVECKGSLGMMAQQQGISHLAVVKRRSQAAAHHQLKKKFHFVLMGTRADGVGALHYFALLFNSQYGVLAGFKGERVLGTHSNRPQILSMIFPENDPGPKKPVSGDGHAAGLCSLQAIRCPPRSPCCMPPDATRRGRTDHGVMDNPTLQNLRTTDAGQPVKGLGGRAGPA